MTLAVCCTLHSPLLEFTDPGPELTADVETAFATTRDVVRGYDPELAGPLDVPRDIAQACATSALG